jgi:hypothetical protein
LPLIWVTDPVRDRIAEIAARRKAAGDPAEFCAVIEGLLELADAAG